MNKFSEKYKQQKLTQKKRNNLNVSIIYLRNLWLTLGLEGNLYQSIKEEKIIQLYTNIFQNV